MAKETKTLKELIAEVEAKKAEIATVEEQKALQPEGSVLINILGNGLVTLNDDLDAMLNKTYRYVQVRNTRKDFEITADGSEALSDMQ